MDEKFEIMELLQKTIIRTKLGSIVYGSVEIREKR